MGALTSNRKRGGDSFSLRYNHPCFDSPIDLHASKKPKITQMQQLSEKPNSQSTYLRVLSYPLPIKPLRTVHAPTRIFSTPMGNVLFRNYKQSINEAADTFRHPRRRDKVLVEVGEDDLSMKDEEVEIIYDNMLRDELNQKSVDDDDDVYLIEKYERFADDNRVQGSSSVVTDLSNQETPKADDVGKMLGDLSVNCELVVGEPPHKKLLKDAETRTPRLTHLSVMIEFAKKKLNFLRLWRTQKKPEEDSRIREPFVELTKDEEAEVSRALSNSNRRKILVTHPDSNIEISGEVLQCLRPGAWLNDEVINLFLELLKEREKREPKRFLKCHFFNTFFYKKLISGKGGYDFKAVKRWTTQRKIGYALLECDMIFVPIHQEIHWCLGIINKKEEKFQYLDSLKGRDSSVLEVMAQYYVDEVKEKSGKEIDVSSWNQEYVSDLPEQKNGFDCGMFMVKYADFYSRGLGLNFGQEHMPYFRKRTVKEVLRLKAE